jgi:hypothetical protein
MSNNDQGSPNKKVRKPAAKPPKPGSKAKGIPRKASKKPEAESISAIAAPHSELKELPIEKRPLPIEEMEVHHHPDLHHKAKPWKEYLIEGLMIFIAVMMGFIAENIREDITNREHVHQLTAQLVRDLKVDIAELDTIHNFQALILKKNDTLFTLLQQPLAKADTKKIQRLIENSHSMYPFHPSLGAIAAIKNEMHLKQLANAEMISYIARYEGHIELIKTVQDISLQYQRLYLDPFLRTHFKPANMAAAFNHSPIPDAQMRNLKQEDLTQLAADMVLIRVVSNELIVNNGRLKNDAVNLLKYVTKQYHLEDE